MGVHLRQSWRLGSRLAHIRANLSFQGLSWTVKLGPWSWNTRARRSRVDLPGPLHWQGGRHRRGDRP